MSVSCLVNCSNWYITGHEPFQLKEAVMETQTLKLRDEAWGQDLLNSLNTMRYSGLLCDVKICLQDNMMLQAHSCVLSAVSPFFSTILHGAQSPELDFKDFPSRMLEQVLTYIYTGEVIVFPSDVPVLHNIANALHIPVLIDMTKNILSESAKDENKATLYDDCDESNTVVQENEADDSKEQAGLEGWNDLDPSTDMLYFSKPESQNELMQAVIESAQTEDELSSGGMVSADTLVIENPKDVNQEELTALTSVLQSQGFHMDLGRNPQQDNLILNEVGEELDQHNLDSFGSQACLVQQDTGEYDVGQGYTCTRCNVGFTSDLAYYKHMKYRHSKAVPPHIHKMLAQERKDRGDLAKSLRRELGKEESLVVKRESIAESENKDPSHWTKSTTRCSGRKKKKISFVNIEEDDWTSDTGQKEKKSVVKKSVKKSEAKKRKRPREDDLVCKVCDKKFKILSMLRLHEYVHKDERPFHCDVCGKGFTQVGNLKAHMRLHTGEKPFQCATCGRGFGQPGHLKAHMRTHTGEKPNVCSQCGRTFSSATNLYAHARLHTGEKPYKCTVCGKAFSQLGNLNTHQRLHTGDKPYKCTHCTKSFTAYCNYQRHLRRHLNMRPIACPDCSKRFVNKSEMQAHQRHKHMLTVKIEPSPILQNTNDIQDIDQSVTQDVQSL